MKWSTKPKKRFTKQYNYDALIASSAVRRTIVFVAFFAIISACWQMVLHIHLQSTALKVVPPQAIAAKNVLLTITPTPTPLPTETPTPTPVQPVYSGYCLHVPVLLYHHIMPQEIAMQKGQTSLSVDNGAFDEQMGYIASHGFTPLFAEDLVSAIHNHTGLPAKSIVVTIDDGYDDIYTYAFPILKKYGIKATLMVPTGLLGIHGGGNSYFNWGQLNEMLGSGLISVGNHTWSHYPMGSGVPAKDVYELITAQKGLQQYVGRNPIVFTYPYGTNATNTFVEQEVAANGFLGAYSTIGGTQQCDSFIYSLHRTRIGNALFPAYGIY